LKLDRIRSIEILELADKFDHNTANLSIELANWLNSKLSFTLIKNVIDKSINTSLSEFYFEEDEVSEVHARRKKLAEIQNDLISLPLELGFDFLNFDDQKDIKSWLSNSEADLILVSGYLKDIQIGWRASLLSQISQSSNALLAIAPAGIINLNFHTLIVPYHLDSLSEEKLMILKWFVEQMGLLVEFVHVVLDEEATEEFELTDKCERAMSMIEEYFNNNLVKFYFPRSIDLNTGLQKFLKHKSNYIMAYIDDFGKNAYLGKSISEQKIEPVNALTVLI
jgi:hypothetical protein